MQLLEHEGKRLLLGVGGVRIPRGAVTRSSQTAAQEASRLGTEVVLKAQVPSGRRGKNGGVVVVPSAEAGNCAEWLLSSTVCGFPVYEILVEEVVAAEREFFLALALSLGTRSAILLVSCDGGVDVEASPDNVASVAVPALVGLQDFHVWAVAQAAQVPLEYVPGLVQVAHAAYRLFKDVEADLVEINPLMATAGGDMVAADVRVVPSAGGSYSRAQVGEPVTVAERAQALGFDLVELDPAGDVGLLSTGAGASMLVVDLLADAGGRPINFCDFRSGRTAGAQERLNLVLDYLELCPALRCLAINFFAGVTDLVPFAELLTSTLSARPLPVPIVVRLEGAGAERARCQLQSIGATVVGSLHELIEQAARCVQVEGASS
jgi:succinyl-CoA synthetase beta subunit